MPDVTPQYGSGGNDSPVIIRKMRDLQTPEGEADLAGVVEVEQRSYSSNMWHRADFLEYMEHKPLVLVAEQQGRVIGFLFCEQHHDGIRVTNMAVHPEMRREKIATRMIESLKEMLPEMGCSYIQVAANSDNTAVKKLFKSCGFDEMHIIRNIDQLAPGTNPAAEHGICVLEYDVRKVQKFATPTSSLESYEDRLKAYNDSLLAKLDLLTKLSNAPWEIVQGSENGEYIPVKMPLEKMPEEAKDRPLLATVNNVNMPALRWSRFIKAYGDGAMHKLPRYLQMAPQKPAKLIIDAGYISHNKLEDRWHDKVLMDLSVDLLSRESPSRG